MFTKCNKILCSHVSICTLSLIMVRKGMVKNWPNVDWTRNPEGQIINLVSNFGYYIHIFLKMLLFKK